MARDPIPTYCFSLVVAKLGRRILLVHERKHGQLWYFPAGRVEPGETFAGAARRETLEEAGVAIELEGILRIERSAWPDHARMRVIYLARPAGDGAPKSEPDDESLEARYVTLDEMRQMPLRGSEVATWSEHVLSGNAAVAPLSLLRVEGEPPG